MVSLIFFLARKLAKKTKKFCLTVESSASAQRQATHTRKISGRCNICEGRKLLNYLEGSTYLAPTVYKHELTVLHVGVQRFYKLDDADPLMVAKINSEINLSCFLF